MIVSAYAYMHLHVCMERERMNVMGGKVWGIGDGEFLGPFSLWNTSS